MSAPGLFNLVVLPIFLGLFGFIEPCSVGTTLVVVKQIEGQPARVRIMQTAMFAATRALFIGALGLLAVLLGAAFLGLQKAAWMILGVLYLSGKAGVLMRSFGLGLARLRTVRGSVALGVLFGLNIPACAAPLLLALLGSAAASTKARTSLAGAADRVKAGRLTFALGRRFTFFHRCC